MLEQKAEFIVDTKAVVTEGDSGELIIEGLASDSETDRQDEAFLPDALDAGIKSYLESNPTLLFHHQFDKALGRVTHLEKRPDGLWMKAIVDPPAAGSWAEDVVNKIKRGTIKGLSVGGRFYRSLVDGKPVIHKADLMEISVTPMPVNPRTLFAVAGKAFQSEDIADLEEPDEYAHLERSLKDLESTFDSLLQRLDDRCHTKG